MSMRRCLLVIGFFAVLGLPGVSSAQKCDSKKAQVAGKYYDCRLKVIAKSVKKIAPPDAGALFKCETKYLNTFVKAEAQEDCSQSGDVFDVKSMIEQMVFDRSDDLDLFAVAGKEGRICAFQQVKNVGKYAACLLKAHAKSIKTGKPLDVSKCDQKLTDKFAKAEAKGGAECPTTGQVETYRGNVANDVSILLFRITVGTTTTTTSTTSTSMPPCPSCADWRVEPGGVDVCGSGCESSPGCTAALALDACMDSIVSGAGCCYWDTNGGPGTCHTTLADPSCPVEGPACSAN